MTHGAVRPRAYPGQVPGETPLARTRRARRILRALAERYPDARIELDFRTPLDLLVATVLSAQSTDRRVNAVTAVLFPRYPTAADYAGADPTELAETVRPTGFFRVKSQSLIRLGEELVARFGGEVPARMEDLRTLPGVGRKTANVVLGNAFGIPGIATDTHVLRLSGRLGLSDLPQPKDDPEAVEAELNALFPRSEWTMASHRLIFHGRRTCHARRPACGACPVAHMCPSYGIGETDPEAAAALVRSEGRA